MRRLYNPVSSTIALIGSMIKGKNPNNIETLPQFLRVPLEICLQVYGYFDPGNMHFPPRFHPFYRLLLVSRFLREEISSIFYATPYFSFSTPRTYLFFLNMTASHMHLLTSLTLHTEPCEIYPLEPIFEKLSLASVPLRHLELHIGQVLSRS
jgi:hypothetical protein